MLERRKLNELSYNELVTLLENNRNFASKILEDAQENYSYFYVDDILHYAPKCASYEIGTYCQGEHFSFNNAIENYSDICDWLEEAQKDYYILGDEIGNSDAIEKLRIIGSHYEEMYHSSLNYNRMEKRYNEIINEICSFIFNYLQEFYNQFFDNGNLADYLQEQINCECYEEFEIDEHFNIFEKVEYTKEYIA